MIALGGRRALLIALPLFAAMAGCSPAHTGVVTGGIIPCAGIPYPGEPHYAAGTVTVLEGQVHWRSTGPGTSAIVFPTAVIVTEQVGVDASYDFILRPGAYVLRARLAAPANIQPWVAVTVHGGDTQQIDIPNSCM
jgi:hypothetical protein